MVNQSKLALTVVFLLLGPGQVFAGEPAAAASRPAAWATPLKMEGLPNLNRVTDTLYRGAQPSAKGMKNLEKLGIKTVVNLRSLHSDRDELKGTSLQYVQIKFNTLHPEEEDVVRFLKLATDPKQFPVFVHCQHGADRTGMMVAFYRMVVQGWSKQEAVKEMTEGGFGFHSIWQHIIKFIDDAEIDKFSKRVD